MIALTVVLAAVFAGGFLTFDGGLEQKTGQFEDELDNQGQSGTSVSTASANPWSGEAGDLVRISNNEAGATNVRYRINFEIEDGSSTINNSLNSVKISVNNDSEPEMFSGIDKSNHLKRAVVDIGSNGTEDINLTSDITGISDSDDGVTLTITLDGDAYELPSAGDSIIVEFSGVDNPANPGKYKLEVETSGDGNTQDGFITIVD